MSKKSKASSLTDYLFDELFDSISPRKKRGKIRAVNSQDSIEVWKEMDYLSSDLAPMLSDSEILRMIDLPRVNASCKIGETLSELKFKSIVKAYEKQEEAKRELSEEDRKFVESLYVLLNTEMCLATDTLADKVEEMV